MSTFSELIKNCTPDEIDAMAWQLAMIRARETWESLRSKNHPPMMEIPKEGWKRESAT